MLLLRHKKLRPSGCGRGHRRGSRRTGSAGTLDRRPRLSPWLSRQLGGVKRRCGGATGLLHVLRLGAVSLPVHHLGPGLCLELRRLTALGDRPRLSGHLLDRLGGACWSHVPGDVSVEQDRALHRWLGLRPLLLWYRCRSECMWGHLNSTSPET